MGARMTSLAFNIALMGFILVEGGGFAAQGPGPERPGTRPAPHCREDRFGRPLGS